MAVVHEDWRDPEELARLYRLYARAGGRFFGKHLYMGDRFSARMAWNDIKTGLRAWQKRLFSAQLHMTDERLARPIWIPIGVLEGLYESWRLSRWVSTGE